MTTIELSDETLARIKAQPGEVAICDAAGAIHGYIVSPVARKNMYDWADAQFANDPLVKPTAGDRRGYTTAEAIAYLKAYEADLRRRS